MNTTLRENKAIIRSFMKAHYTDDRLAQLLDHARSGKLDFQSCCCFVGITTADHELQPRTCTIGGHYKAAKAIPGAALAEYAYSLLENGMGEEASARGRRRIIPMVKAEIRRRAITQKYESESSPSLCAGRG